MGVSSLGGFKRKIKWKPPKTHPSKQKKKNLTNLGRKNRTPTKTKLPPLPPERKNKRGGNGTKRPPPSPPPFPTSPKETPHPHQKNKDSPPPSPPLPNLPQRNQVPQEPAHASAGGQQALHFQAIQVPAPAHGAVHQVHHRPMGDAQPVARRVGLSHGACSVLLVCTERLAGVKRKPKGHRSTVGRVPIPLRQSKSPMKHTWTPNDDRVFFGGKRANGFEFLVLNTSQFKPSNKAPPPQQNK